MTPDDPSSENIWHIPGCWSDLAARTGLVVEVQDAVVRLQEVWVGRGQVAADGESRWDLFGLLHAHYTVVLRLAHANVTMATGESAK